MTARSSASEGVIKAVGYKSAIASFAGAFLGIAGFILCIASLGAHPHIEPSHPFVGTGVSMGVCVVGCLLAVCAATGWSGRAGRKSYDLPTSTPGGVTALAVAPDGSWLPLR